MAAERKPVTTPVGRFVSGSLYKPQTKDADGKPLVTKTGPEAGKPTQKYVIGIAIAKDPAAGHWGNTEWGKVLWAAGHSRLANAGQMGENFAWKVTDGDDPRPNKKGKAPNTRDGFPGHWVVWFSGKFAPKAYNGIGLQVGQTPPEMPQPDAIMPGYYIQVSGTVGDNESTQNPGLYLNPSMVCLRGYGEVIVGAAADPSQAGFGGGVLPTGASATPPAGAMPQQPPAGHPAANTPPPPGYTSQPPAAAAPQTPVAPNPAFTANAQAPFPQPPGAAAPPVPPAAPAQPAGPDARLTGTAGAFSVAQLVAAGWSEATLIAAGHLRPA